jgi:hypothetical protein
LLLLAVVGLWPFLRSLGVRHWSDVGLGKQRGAWGRVGSGFALSFCSLGCAAALELAVGARSFNWDYSAQDFGKQLGKIGVTAVVVSGLEESLFRGALFGALRKTHDCAFALAVSSTIFALLHFLQRSEAPTPIHWASGLALLPRMARGLVEWERLVPGFFNLSLVGVILGLAYERSGNLYFSMGLHGGWIFCQKSHGFLTCQAPNVNLWFWGTDKLIDGWLAFGVLALTLALVCRRHWTAEIPRKR